MNKRIVNFLFGFIAISITLLPLKVSAIPGCCSWHGGEAGCSGSRTLCADGTVSSCPCDGTSSNYGGNGISSNNYQSNDIGDKIEMVFWIVVIGGFIALEIYGNIYDSTDKKKKEEEDRERRKELLRKQREEKKEEMRRIGTNYSSENQFVNKINNAMAENNLSEELLDDGYLSKIEPNELFKKICLNNSPESYLEYKRIIDKLVEKNKNAEYYYKLLLSIMENESLNIKFSKYLVAKTTIDDSYVFGYNGKLIAKALQINKKQISELLLDKDILKGFDYDSLKVIYANDIDIYNKILNDSKSHILDDSFDFNSIYKNEEKHMLSLYLNKGIITKVKLNQIFKDLINKNDIDLMKTFLYNCSTMWQVSQDNLIFAYYNKSKDMLNFLIKHGFSKDLFSTINEQKKFEKFLYEDGEWFEVKQTTDIYNFDKQMAKFIRDNNFDDFSKLYNNSNSKNAQLNGETLLFLAIKYNRIDFVDYILKNGGSFDRLENCYETNGVSPLEFAIYMNRYKIAEVIIEDGANINYPDSDRCLPLDYACFLSSNIKFCKYLIEKGAKSCSDKIYNDFKKTIESNEKYYGDYVLVSSISKLNKKYKKGKK